MLRVICRWRALGALVCGALALSIVDPPVTHALGLDSLRSRSTARPVDLDGAKARDDLRERSLRERRSSAPQRALRARSRHAFADQSDSDAVTTAREQLDVDERGWRRPPHVLKRLDDQTAMVSMPDGRGVIARSSVPLWTDDPAGKRVPVDLAVKDDGEVLRPVAPIESLTMSETASGGTRLGDLRFTPTGAGDARGQALADKATYPNVQTDTDYMVAATPDGAEAQWVLRSALSPEELGLDFSLPEGATLVKQDRDPAGAAVERDGRTIARIAPPIAVDADGVAVPARYEVAEDRLKVIVEHRDRDVRMPILVDPGVAVVHGTGPNGNPGWYLGWNSLWYNCAELRFSVSGAMQAYASGPLTAGCFGLWRYQAPGSAYVFEVDYAGIGHYSYPFNGVHYGIVDSNLVAPSGGGVYTNGSQPPFAANPAYETATFEGARRVCTTSQNNAGGLCPSTVGNSGNAAFIGLYNSYSGSYPSTQNGYARGTTVYLSDRAAPTAPTITGLPTGWTSSPPASFNVSSTQGGVGIDAFQVDFPGGGYPSSTSLATGCNTQYQPPYAPCPQSATKGIPITGTVPEGAQTVAVRASTPVFLSSPAATATLKVDRTAPTVSASSDLFDLVDNYISGSGTYSASVGATDGVLSGVARVGLQRDSSTEIASATATCPSDSSSPRRCGDAPATTVSFDGATRLPEGKHTLRAFAVDDAGNTGYGPTSTVYVDRTAPAFASGAYFVAQRDAATGEAIVSWDVPTDPQLADGSPSAGTSMYQVRYKRPADTDWSNWASVDLPRINIPGVATGESLQLETKPQDSAGNLGLAYLTFRTTIAGGDRCDPTADGLPGDCGADEDETFVDPEASIRDGTDGTGATQASGAVRRVIKTTNPDDWVTVRSWHKSYVIGNAHDGWSFDKVNQTYTGLSVGYLNGEVGGGLNMCGWVRAVDSTDTGTPTSTDCKQVSELKPGRPPTSTFASAVNCGKCDEPSTYNVRIERITDVCLNVRPSPLLGAPTKCVNKSGVVTKVAIEQNLGWKVKWRYITRGLRPYVMVRDGEGVPAGKGVWYFVPRRALGVLCTAKNQAGGGRGDGYQCGPPNN